MIATCFNEPNNEIVWSESLILTRDMLKYWSERPSITSSADDLRSLSLHILASAGFGKSSKWEGHEERTRNSVSGDYKDSLRSYKPLIHFGISIPMTRGDSYKVAPRPL